MILNQDTPDVQTNVTNKSKEFTIKTTAKAFKILSSGLYSDKIKAIIRELSCNAWDSHKSARNKNPFFVHLPGSLEPWFSVRDFGIGLSEEDVMNLYSTYFESTKTNSNDQIGALGLGSKSPFSYTDSFNVTSIFDGFTKTYTAFIDKSGTPSIVKIHEEESGEHNGLEIKFAVDKQDFDEFAKKAGVVFRVFTAKPTVVGNTRYTSYEQTMERVLEGKGWFFYKTSFYNSEKCMALQGNIEYPIDHNQLGELTNQQKFVVENKFYLDFKIGELDIAASREGLGYDEPTVANIKIALDRAYSEFAGKLKKKIDVSKTLWDAHITAVKLMNNMDLRYHHTSHLQISWKGKKLTLNEQMTYYFSKWGQLVDGKKTVDILDSKLKIVSFRMDTYSRASRVSRSDDYSADDDDYESRVSIHPSNEVHFVVNDEPNEKESKVVRKARQVAKNNRGHYVYLLNSMSKKFFTAMGNPEYTLSSTIVLEKPVRKNGKSSMPEDYFKINNTSFDNFAFDNIDESLDSREGNFYLHKVREKFVWGEQDYSHMDLANLFNFLKKIGAVAADKSLLAIRPAETSLKRFSTLKWIDFIAFAAEAVKKYIGENADTIKAPIIIEKRKEFIESKMDYYVREKMISELKDHEVEYPATSCFMNVARIVAKSRDAAHDNKQAINDTRHIMSMANILGINIQTKLEFSLDDVDYMKTYPMLELTNSSWNYRDKFDVIRTYIIMVDKSKEE